MGLIVRGRPDGPPGEAPGSGDVRPSTVTTPKHPPEGVVSLLDFFVMRFPRISEATWRARFDAGKVWSEDGVVDAGDPFRPGLQLHYRREVEREPPVRRDYRIEWSDADLVVVDKPPHLPVTPGGGWVRNCLLHLLSRARGDHSLAPLHRIDRLTSGLVVFSRNRETRRHFGELFQGGWVEKTYSAVCEVRRPEPPAEAALAHHLSRSPDEYWRQVVCEDRRPNARCDIELVSAAGGLALYRVRPRTGRKHQIRVQLAASGLPILGDPLYGSRPFHDPDDLATRLWLDAHALRVGGFPRPRGASPLSGEWRSSRDPDDLFRRALDARRSAARPRRR